MAHIAMGKSLSLICGTRLLVHANRQDRYEFSSSGGGAYAKEVQLQHFRNAVLLAMETLGFLTDMALRDFLGG